MRKTVQLIKQKHCTETVKQHKDRNSGGRRIKVWISRQIFGKVDPTKIVKDKNGICNNLHVPGSTTDDQISNDDFQEGMPGTILIMHVCSDSAQSAPSAARQTRFIYTQKVLSYIEVINQTKHHASSRKTGISIVTSSPKLMLAPIVSASRNVLPNVPQT